MRALADGLISLGKGEPMEGSRSVRRRAGRSSELSEYDTGIGLLNLVLDGEGASVARRLSFRCRASILSNNVSLKS